MQQQWRCSGKKERQDETQVHHQNWWKNQLGSQLFHVVKFTFPVMQLVLYYAETGCSCWTLQLYCGDKNPTKFGVMIIFKNLNPKSYLKRYAKCFSSRVFRKTNPSVQRYKLIPCEFINPFKFCFFLYHISNSHGWFWFQQNVDYQVWTVLGSNFGWSMKPILSLVVIQGFRFWI